jgi:syringomycin synthetase protein SyrE
MVPSAFVVVERLPLTPNGKLDRRALPAPQSSAYATCEYEAPQGEVEEALAGIWKSLLRLEKVGRHDSFFELGGHSLMAMQVMVALQSAFSVEVPMSLLLEFPTLQELASEVDRIRSTHFMEGIAAGGEMDGLIEQVMSMSEKEATEWMKELRARSGT